MRRRDPPGVLRAVAAALAVASVSVGACGDSPARVRVTVEVDVRGGGAPVTLTPARLALHVAGTPRAEAWRHEPLPPESWRDVAVSAKRAAPGALVADGEVAPGRYDYLWLDISAAAAGEEALQDVVEPIGWQVELTAGAQADLTLELVVLPSATQPGRRAILAKRLRSSLQ